MPGRSSAFLARTVERIPSRWRTDLNLWIDFFALINLTFLSLDIYIAHSTNNFGNRAEFIPLIFSLAAPLLLIPALIARELLRRTGIWSVIGYIVGGLSIVIGLAGVVYHLDSQFFYERTLRSLTYAAPFAAPLAYTGIGMLLVMNRMVPQDSEEWAQWVLLLTLGGFFGNFVLSLTDHATNGFFSSAEWIPVVSAAFGVAFLAMPFMRRVDTRYLGVCGVVLVAQIVVGVLGFVLHGLADVHGPSRNLMDNVIYGAPPFAPLLFPNLALLGCIGLWALRLHVSPGPDKQAIATDY